MNRVNIENLVMASSILIVGMMIALILGFSEEVNLDSIIKWLPTAISIYGVLLIAFTKWLWKCPVFQGWLVLIPDLSGKWSGTLTYRYPAGTDKLSTKKVKAIIKQDLFNITMKMETNEMRSTSIIAAFDIDKSQDRMEFSYTYVANPKPEFRESNPMHKGTGLLDIMGKPPNKLIGEYWTTRRTIGSVELNKITKALMLNSNKEGRF